MSFYSHRFRLFEVITLPLKKFVDYENLIHVVNIAQFIFFTSVQRGLVGQKLKIATIKLQSIDNTISEILKSLLQH